MRGKSMKRKLSIETTEELNSVTTGAVEPDNATTETVVPESAEPNHVITKTVQPDNAATGTIDIDQDGDDHPNAGEETPSSITVSMYAYLELLEPESIHSECPTKYALLVLISL